MTKPPSPKPLSIKLIALFFLITAIGLWVVFPTDFRAGTSSFLGLSLKGLVARGYLLGDILLISYLPIGLWRLYRPARFLAIAVIVISLLENVHIDSQGLRAITVLHALDAYVLSLAMIWFLVKRKSAFIKLPTSSQAST